MRPESVVGLALGRPLCQIVGILGVLKAGGAYLPLDPATPRSRLEAMLADAIPGWLLVDDAAPDDLPTGDADVFRLDHTPTPPPPPPPAHRHNRSSDLNPAHTRR